MSTQEQVLLRLIQSCDRLETAFGEDAASIEDVAKAAVREHAEALEQCMTTSGRPISSRSAFALDAGTVSASVGAPVPLAAQGNQVAYRLLFEMLAAGQSQRPTPAPS
jgi:hypothetical protein